MRIKFRPKFRIHRNSLTFAIATAAVELHLSPIDLLDAPDGVLEAIFAYLKERSRKK